METKKLNCLKKVLVTKGIKQKWLSEQLGTTTVVVNLWCSNKTQPSLTKLNEIANILQIDVRELLVSNQDEK
jgi:putative transcriptional regulator